MQIAGTDLLKNRRGDVKFLMNDHAVAFFPGQCQHRDMKLLELSYSDDYKGNAVAGILTADHVEIRFHKAFSDERIRTIWTKVTALPEIAHARLGPAFYQGRRI